MSCSKCMQLQLYAVVRQVYAVALTVAIVWWEDIALTVVLNSCNWASSCMQLQLRLQLRPSIVRRYFLCSHTLLILLFLPNSERCTSIFVGSILQVYVWSRIGLSISRYIKLSMKVCTSVECVFQKIGRVKDELPIKQFQNGIPSNT